MAIEPFQLFIQNTSHLTIASHYDLSDTTRAKDKKNLNNHTKQHAATGSKIYINRNCFIIFNADLVHAGTSYPLHSSTCYRMHMYFLPQDDKSKMDTYVSCDICMPLEEDGCEICKNIYTLPKMRALNSRKFMMLLFSYLFIYLFKLIILLLEFDLHDDVTDRLPMATYIGGNLKKLGWAIYKGPEYDRDSLLSVLEPGNKNEVANSWWEPINHDSNRKYIKCSPKDNLEANQTKKRFLKRVEDLKNAVHRCLIELIKKEKIDGNLNYVSDTWSMLKNTLSSPGQRLHTDVNRAHDKKL